MSRKTFKNEKGEVIELESEIASSGEGKVWTVKNSDLVAKIYHKSPDKKQIEKLAIMIANPPNNPNVDHVPWAWPESFVLHSRSKVGFLMRKIEGKQIIEVYNPQRRRIEQIDANWQFLHAVALNFVTVVRELHSAGYVIGDIKPQNVLTNARGQVSIVDIDSIQVKDPTKSDRIYNCPVGTPSTTPPELVGKRLANEIQTEAQDRFRIGIIVFQLLFGEHPFKSPNGGELLTVEQLIEKRLWIHGSNSSINGARLIPLDVVHPQLQDCFRRCFDSTDPELRPTAREWKKAIEKGYDNLVACPNISALPDKSHPHFYSNHLPSCYWCDRAQKIGYDMFGMNAVQQVMSSELTRLIRLDKSFVQVIGKVSSTNVKNGGIVLRLGKGHRDLKCGAFEIVIASQVVNSLTDAERMNLLDARGQEISVKGTISVAKTNVLSTPRIIVDSQPLTCQIVAPSCLN